MTQSNSTGAGHTSALSAVHIQHAGHACTAPGADFVSIDSKSAFQTGVVFKLSRELCSGKPRHPSLRELNGRSSEQADSTASQKRSQPDRVNTELRHSVPLAARPLSIRKHGPSRVTCENRCPIQRFLYVRECTDQGCSHARRHQQSCSHTAVTRPAPWIPPTRTPSLGRCCEHVYSDSPCGDYFQ